MRYQLDALLREPEDRRLYRFQFQLSEDNKGLDKTDTESLRALILKGQNLIDTEAEKLNQVCEALGKRLFDRLHKEVMQRRS